jgi:SpoVK/Ycf46/Vps4 family AAA+-type ATPase
MCSGFTGADCKSVACDALINAFHRVQNSIKDENQNDQELIKSLIEIKKKDLVTSIESIKKNINKNEREALNRL